MNKNKNTRICTYCRVQTADKIGYSMVPGHVTRRNIITVELLEAQ